LENAILSRFPKMTLKEIQKMIQLTPLDKTFAGQELIQMGRIEGRMEGKIIGKIHLAQRLLKHPITPKKKLLEKTPKELRAILKKLETELKAW
jgi:predicted transposase YdaD